MTRCSYCPFFKHTHDECGICKLNGYKMIENDDCLYECLKNFNLTARGAEMVLHYDQKWRRGANICMPNPMLTGKAIDKAIRTFRTNRHIK